MASPTSVYRELDDRALLAEMRRLAALKNPATMGRYLDPTQFRIRAHTRLIGNALTGLGTQYDRLLLTTPPQVGKSTITSELLPFWWLARDPRAKIVIGSYAATLSIKKGRAVRRHIQENGAAFGLKLQKGETGSHDFSVTAGGGVRSVGVGGSLTGFPASLAICDDPHKDRREADSLRMRNRVWDWWSSVFLSRLRPGSPVVLILTRWHEDDLAARVLNHEGVHGKGGRWRLIDLPAIATSPDDPLGRDVGDPLSHPALEDTDIEALLTHWKDKRSTSTPRDWGALYQADPQPTEGALITRAQLAACRMFSGFPEAERIAIGVDPSGGGDDTAGIVAGFRGTDGRLYITHDRTRALSAAEWPRRVCLLAHEIGAHVLFIEKYGGDLATMAIRTAWNALQAEGRIPKDDLPPYCDSKSARGNKVQRAEPIAQQWIEQRIRTTQYMPEYEEEWATWQPDSSYSPGRIDATVYLAHGLLKIPGLSNFIGNAANVSLTQAAAQGGGLGGISLGRGR